MLNGKNNIKSLLALFKIEYLSNGKGNNPGVLTLL